MNSSSDTSKDKASELELATLPHPVQGTHVLLFRDWRSAVDHVRDHLLTAPECEAWCRVRPEFGEVIDVTDRKASEALARAAEDSRGTALQALYDRLAVAVKQNVDDARQLGWLAKEDDAAWALTLGTDGVLVVFVPWVRTAFLPGQGSAAMTATARRHEAATILPRDQGMRSGRPRLSSGRNPPAPQKVEANWTPEQWRYFRVFRPAVQAVRRYHAPAYTHMNSRLRRGEYGALKRVLPTMSELKFEHWQQYRRDCRLMDEPS